MDAHSCQEVVQCNPDYIKVRIQKNIRELHKLPWSFVKRIQIKLRVKVDIIFRIKLIFQNLAEEVKSLMLIVAKKSYNATSLTESFKY